MQRERKRKETHDIRPRKYRAWFVEGDGTRLPEPVYALARRMQDCWTDIALHEQQAYDEWRKAHPASAPPDGLEEEALEKWRKENWPKPPKPFYAGNQDWAEGRVKQASLPDELGQTILDRLSVTFKNMRKGGGPPKPHRRLDKFALHHRYTCGGLPVHRLGGERSKRFRILLPSPQAYGPQRGVKNPREMCRRRACPAWFRVDGVPVHLNVMMHRPLPEGDAYVKRVALVGKKSSVAMPWEIHLILTIEVPFEKEATAPAGTQCGIDVGWRKLDDDRMRIAVLYNGQPTPEELVLPLRLHDRRLGEVSLERLANLKRCRDGLLERTKDAVAAMLSPLPAGWTQMRNGGLVCLMRDEGTPAEAVAVLKAWKQDNDRYLRMERMVEGHLRRHYEWRRGNWAKDVAARHRTVRIEKMNQQEMWGAKKVKEIPALKASAERRRLAACGSLLGMIRHAVSKARGELAEVEAAHTTDTCSVCDTHFEAGPGIMGRCERGHEMDQDWNAARNICARRAEATAEAAVA
ncbi:MAG: hypothetical protein ABSC21_22990 [Terriglobia bacterium]|jgi:hypothetical protein